METKDDTARMKGQNVGDAVRAAPSVLCVEQGLRGVMKLRCGSQCAH
jgi:hypothetical protein